MSGEFVSRRGALLRRPPWCWCWCWFISMARLLAVKHHRLVAPAFRFTREFCAAEVCDQGAGRSALCRCHLSCCANMLAAPTPLHFLPVGHLPGAVTRKG